jgi:hypothetical protein
VALRPFGLSTTAFIPAVGVNISITAMASLAIGAFIGSTRSFGGVARIIRVGFTRPADAPGPAVLNEKEQTSDAPDHQVAVYDFEKFTCIWEHRQFGGSNAGKHSLGSYYYGTKGTLHIGWRDGWTFYPANKKDKVVHEDSQLEEPEGHSITLLWADFIDAIEGKSKGVANIELAHRSTVLSLLGMVSLRAGRSLNWDASKEQIIGDDEANKLLSRPYRAPWVYPVA